MYHKLACKTAHNGVHMKYFNLSQFLNKKFIFSINVEYFEQIFDVMLT